MDKRKYPYMTAKKVYTKSPSICNIFIVYQENICIEL